MSLNFSANQYEKSFSPYNLQNWEIPREHKERPQQHGGFTQFIANDKGHLMEGVKRSRESPWGNFVGTWDLPEKIPGNKQTNTTARSCAAAENLCKLKMEGDEVISGQNKHLKVPDPLPIKDDMTADKSLVPSPPPQAFTEQSKADNTAEKVMAPQSPTQVVIDQVAYSPDQMKPASRNECPMNDVPSPIKAPSPTVDFKDVIPSKSPINWPPSTSAKK